MSCGKRKLQLELLAGGLAVCRLESQSPLPEWASGEFVSITRTPDELSVVCPQEAVPKNIRCRRGWRCLKVVGPLDFDLTGILSSLAFPLAQAAIPIFALSSYETDYLLVEERYLEKALRRLRRAGHVILTPDSRL